MCSG
jgi:hypothetical protein